MITERTEGMNRKQILSGATALALLCSAWGCGQNGSEQTHAQVQQTTGASGTAPTDASAGTAPAVTTTPPAAAATDAPASTAPAVSSTAAPAIQTYHYVVSKINGRPKGDSTTTQPSTTEPEPIDWRQALNEEIKTFGGVTSLKKLGIITYQGTAYGFKKRTISEDTYEYIFFSVDQNNQGKILKRWTDIRPYDSLFAIYSMYFCNGRFYLYDQLSYKKYVGTEHLLEIYDPSGDHLQTYTLPEFYSWYSKPAENAMLFSDDFITVCGNGCILTHEYKTRDAYDRMHYFYLIDPYTGEKTALPPPKDGAFGFFYYNEPIQPLLVDGVYQNKLYVTCVDEYKQKKGYWYDLDAGEWHALNVELNNSASASISNNYAIGRYLITRGRIYDMETDQFLPDVPEGEIPSDPNSLLDPSRTLTVNDTGVYVSTGSNSDKTPVLLWD